MNDFLCEKCAKPFGSTEALAQHSQSKHPEDIKKPRSSLSPKQKRKIRNWTIIIVVLGLIVGGIWYLVSNIKTLPPTDMKGHIEVNPPSHILKEPMKIAIQKHMLEHADGEGPPGVIINYNCIDFDCEEGLVEKLEAFVEKYPDFLYVAPFLKMDVKIALTRLGRIEILESYDEERIENFILRG